MNKKWFGAAFIAIFAMSSCLEKDIYQGPKEEEKEFNDFDFSTVQSTTSLEVSYLNSGVKANVYLSYTMKCLSLKRNMAIVKRLMFPLFLQPIRQKTVSIKEL